MSSLETSVCTHGMHGCVLVWAPATHTLWHPAGELMCMDLAALRHMVLSAHKKVHPMHHSKPLFDSKL